MKKKVLKRPSTGYIMRGCQQIINRWTKTLSSRSPVKSIHFCICLALTGFLIILSCPGASASAAVDPRRKPTIYAKQELLNPPVDHPIEKYQVTVWVNVPHNKNGKESLRAVPYLIELPKARNGYSAITEEYSDLKSSLYSLGFANRQNRGLHLYNGRGWRFTYAMDSAVRESGLGYPNTLFEANSWCEEIYPYLK